MDNFNFNYNRWIEACKQELAAKGYGATQINKCEISEDGSVHFSGNAYSTSPNLVTRWDASPFYTDWK